ncbi:MAG: hypothetical protein IJ179_02085 [Oscillospiraceae bacterium]|nr:hypothetical protein [Oscillospiraceae bacterium]
MKLEVVRIVAVALLVLMLVVAIAGRLIFGVNEIVGYAVIGLLALMLAVIAIWGRCPHCGKHLFWGFFKLQECPKCGRSLTEERS